MEIYAITDYWLLVEEYNILNGLKVQTKQTRERKEELYKIIKANEHKFVLG